MGHSSVTSIENACKQLGLTREDCHEELQARYDAEWVERTAFERWCRDHEDVIRKLQSDPKLVEQIRSKV